MKPSEIIIRYNAMHGTTISLIKLMEFRDVVRPLVGTKTVYADDIKGILQRTIKVIKAMKLSGAGTIKLDIKPITIKQEVKEKVIIERVKPGLKVVVPKKLLGLPAKTVAKVVAKPSPVVLASVKKVVNIKPVNPSSGSLSGVNYKYYEMDLGEFKSEFGVINSDANMMIYGPPGSGKTYKLLKLAKQFADKGVNVLYVANEEYGKSTLDAKLKELNIHNGYKNLTVTRNLPVDLSPYAVIYFDSVNTMKLTPEMIKALDEKFPNKLFIIIVQTNKDGTFRGGRDWEHLVDVNAEVSNRKIILHKQRFDPDKVKRDDQPLKKTLKEGPLKSTSPKYEPETIIMKVA